MNYKRIYDQLISKAQTRGTVDGYKERHHIIPRSMNGSDDKSNLVDLTAREHFIAHMCLALIHGGTQWSAVVFMKGGQNQYYSSRLYEIARIEYAVAQKIKLTGSLRPDVTARFKGIPLSEAHSAKISAALKGKPLSEEHKITLSIAHTGVPLSESHVAAIVAGNKGKTRSKAQGAAISAAKKGIPWSPAQRAAYEKSKFDRECKKLNTLIDSVFQ